MITGLCLVVLGVRKETLLLSLHMFCTLCIFVVIQTVESHLSLYD